MSQQNFGGQWTEDKLKRVRKYLVAYSTIMNSQKLFDYFYIDAFAGTGYRTLKVNEKENTLMFPELVDQQSQKFLHGSARIALEVNPRFSKYIFIEKDEAKLTELQKLKIEFPVLAADIEIINSDANQYISQLCCSKTWRSERAVLFLDPYGMQIPWSTIELIAQTKAIDLWYLFPIGVAINRLLKKDGNISPSIKERLNETFGTENWYEHFYQIKRQRNLFEDFTYAEKSANIESISKYFVERLKTVFPGVATNPLLLKNSLNAPMYLLCFAAANEKGAKTAIKIAQDILKK